MDSQEGKPLRLPDSVNLVLNERLGIMENSTGNETGGTTAAGFVVLDSLPVIDPKAVRLLPAEAPGIAIAVAGDIVSIVCPQAPSPGVFRELERLAGMLVTISVATPEVWAELNQTANVSSRGSADLPAMLVAAAAAGASDLHLAAGHSPVVRVGGALREIPDFPSLSAGDTATAARWICGDAMDSFDGDVDRGFSFGGSRWRAAIWSQRGSIAITLRLVPVDVPRLEDLGLPASVVALSKLTQGLVLFCGPTGSGKSTSMAGLVDRINRTRACHIVTIEDPIEYVHPSHLAQVRQREVGADTVSFSTGLRSALRQDPDVILVGELRDTDTMRTALNAAETGHLVLATVHASSATGAVSRIMNSFPAEQHDQVRLQLASSLQAVVVQLLLPDKRKAGSRVLSCEVLLASPAVRAMLRDGRLHEITSTIDTQAQNGMTSMDRSLAALASSGTVDTPIARAHAIDPAAFEEHLKRGSSVIESAFDSLDPLGDILDQGR